MNPLRTMLAAVLVLSAGAAAQPQQTPPTVTIALASYRYAPSPIVLEAGRPVRLVFENRAGKGHDFTAPEFFAASRLLSGNVRDGEVNVDAGKSAAVELVPAKGAYPVHCGKFMHAMMGMKTQVVVR